MSPSNSPSLYQRIPDDPVRLPELDLSISLTDRLVEISTTNDKTFLKRLDDCISLIQDSFPPESSSSNLKKKLKVIAESAFQLLGSGVLDQFGVLSRHIEEGCSIVMLALTVWTREPSTRGE